MVFDIERKYIILITALSAGLLVGGFVLFRQKSAVGIASAQISRVFNGSGRWMEIKPRAVDIAAVKTVIENKNTGSPALTSEKNTAKAAIPAINWCARKNSDRNQKKVVINEVAWMGSAQSYSDEWIELKNLTRNDIDLNGWQLQNKSQKIKISFSAGDILPAAGFYLLERTNDDSASGVAADKIYSGSLGNNDESLYLFDDACVVEDLILGAGKWPAGDNAAKRTMMRMPDLSWKTSKLPGGTPKAENF